MPVSSCMCNLWCGATVQVVRRLEAVVAAEGSPSDDASLLFMTRLMQLGEASSASPGTAPLLHDNSW